MKGADCRRGSGALQDLKSKESNELCLPVAQSKQGKHGPPHKNTLLAAAGCDLQGQLEGLSGGVCTRLHSPS